MKSLNEFLNESNTPNKESKAIQKLIDEVNGLIATKDSDGDPIEVIDYSGTWHEPMVYSPITFKDNVVTISYVEPLNRNKKNSEEYDLNDYFQKGEDSEEYWKYNELIDTLKLLRTNYKKAIKQHNK